MDEFPLFMRNRKNLIDAGSQYTRDIEGYVFDGADGSQMAFWHCHADRDSREHSHAYDEYFVVVRGRYVLRMKGQEIVLNKGDEAFIPKNTAHSGSSLAGTRTIHAFGGTRAKRVAQAEGSSSGHLGVASGTT
jgi:quercetin dioxygenase-like cupin family protein